MPPLDALLDKDVRIYLINGESAQCFYYFNLGPEIHEVTLDQQLIGGFAVAQAQFCSGMLNEQEEIVSVNVTINDHLLENRSLIKEGVVGSIILYKVQELDDTIYKQLDTLMDDLLLKFNQRYQDGLEELTNRGSISFPHLNDFVKSEVIRMKEQMHTTYLQSIISRLYTKIDDKRLKKLMNKLRKVNDLLEDYASRDEIDFSMLEHYFVLINGIQNVVKHELQRIINPATLKQVVELVNNSPQSSVWQFFRVPFITYK